MINRVVIVGRLTRDPDVRKTTSGTSVASFTVALDNRMKGPNGEKTTSFIPCTVWNQTAEYVSKFCRKGMLVGVEGRLNQRTYDSKEGKKVSVVEVIGDQMSILESKGNNQQAANSAPTVDYVPDAVPSDEEEKNVSSIDVADDDLPF